MTVQQRAREEEVVEVEVEVEVTGQWGMVLVASSICALWLPCWNRARAVCARVCTCVCMCACACA